MKEESGTKSDDEEKLGRFNFLTSHQYIEDVEAIIDALQQRVHKAIQRK
jgi:hypothetical protein